MHVQPDSFHANMYHVIQNSDAFNSSEAAFFSLKHDQN